MQILWRLYKEVLKNQKIIDTGIIKIFMGYFFVFFILGWSDFYQKFTDFMIHFFEKEYVSKIIDFIL